MTETQPNRDPLHGVELSRRDAIKRIVVGSAFAVPVVASFDMASLGLSSAYANNANQDPAKKPSFGSANKATFTVGEELTFAIWTPGSGPVTVSKRGRLPAGLSFTQIAFNYDDYNDCNAIISGKPKPGTEGVHHITLTASNEQGHATQKFTVTVNKARKRKKH